MGYGREKTRSSKKVACCHSKVLVRHSSCFTISRATHNYCGSGHQTHTFSSHLRQKLISLPHFFNLSPPYHTHGFRQQSPYFIGLVFVRIRSSAQSPTITRLNLRAYTQALTKAVPSPFPSATETAQNIRYQQSNPSGPTAEQL